MTARVVAVLLGGIAAGGVARADHASPVPRPASFTTLAVTPLAIEGLTGDDAGNLYTTGRDAAPAPCPVWRFHIASRTRTTVGFLPNATGCGPSGIAFDAAGDLYIADGSTVWKLTPDGSAPPIATAFATGVPGTNGLAFDGDGNLWTGDGTTGRGRVWRIDPGGGTCEGGFAGCVEVFRIQPMRNGADLGGALAAPGVGRGNQPVPLNTPQNLVANGLAFGRDGDLFVADTARGAIWRVELHRNGNLKSRTGCDATFTANTLCLDNILVAHPYLEGADGIALDRAGNVWASVNERNAIVAVTRQGVVEVFRNPVNAAGLRNAADGSVGNHRVLEFPTSPVVAGRMLCTASSDGNRRDNSPNDGGEVASGGPVGARGKISCMDQELRAPGLPLPAPR